MAIGCMLAGVVACGARTGPDAAPVAASGTPSGTAGPSESHKTVTVTKKIPFRTRTVEDASLADGKVKIRTEGAAGVETLTYRVTAVDGVEQGRKLIRRETVKKPTARVEVVGIRSEGSPGGSCHPNYGGCVPIASDVDCAGGSGNGPEYVSGPVPVKGADVYGLDRDGDGVACDS